MQALTRLTAACSSMWIVVLFVLFPRVWALWYIKVLLRLSEDPSCPFTPAWRHFYPVGYSYCHLLFGKRSCEIICWMLDNKHCFCNLCMFAVKFIVCATPHFKQMPFSYMNMACRLLKCLAQNIWACFAKSNLDVIIIIVIIVIIIVNYSYFIMFVIVNNNNNNNNS